MSTILSVETKRGRGNPNWTRAAAERRARAERAGGAESKQETPQAPVVPAISTMVGAVVGAMAVTAAAPRLGVTPQKMAVGAAVVGFATAANTAGWVRGIGLGLGAAASALVIAQRAEAARAQERRLATREDLKAALKRFVELRKSAEAVTSPPAAPEVSRPEAQSTPPKVLERLEEVVERLIHEERAQLGAFIDHAPEETLRMAQTFLLDSSTEESLAFLREHLLVGRTL